MINLVYSPFLEVKDSVSHIDIEGLKGSVSVGTVFSYECVCVLVAQSYPTHSEPKGCSLPGSSVHGIL